MKKRVNTIKKDINKKKYLVDKTRLEKMNNIDDKILYYETIINNIKNASGKKVRIKVCGEIIYIPTDFKSYYSSLIIELKELYLQRENEKKLKGKVCQKHEEAEEAFKSYKNLENRITKIKDTLSNFAFYEMMNVILEDEFEANYNEFKNKVKKVNENLENLYIKITLIKNEKFMLELQQLNTKIENLEQELKNLFSKYNKSFKRSIAEEPEVNIEKLIDNIDEKISQIPEDVMNSTTSFNKYKSFFDKENSKPISVELQYNLPRKKSIKSIKSIKNRKNMFLENAKKDIGNTKNKIKNSVMQYCKTERLKYRLTNVLQSNGFNKNKISYLEKVAQNYDELRTNKNISDEKKKKIFEFLHNGFNSVKETINKYYEIDQFIETILETDKIENELNNINKVIPTLNLSPKKTVLCKENLDKLSKINQDLIKAMNKLTDRAKTADSKDVITIYIGYKKSIRILKSDVNKLNSFKQQVSNLNIQIDKYKSKYNIKLDTLSTKIIEKIKSVDCKSIKNNLLKISENIKSKAGMCLLKIKSIRKPKNKEILSKQSKKIAKVAACSLGYVVYWIAITNILYSINTNAIDNNTNIETNIETDNDNQKVLNYTNLLNTIEKSITYNNILSNKDNQLNDIEKEENTFDMSEDIDNQIENSTEEIGFNDISTEVKFTLKEDALVYSNMYDAAAEQNGQKPYYSTSTERVPENIKFILDGEEIKLDPNDPNYEIQIADLESKGASLVVKSEQMEGFYNIDDINELKR